MKILLAEDDPVSRRFVEKFLLDWGYDVVSVIDGNEAWWALQQEDAPSLAILDWMMPGMDGVQVCREVRKRAGERYVYMLLLTARAQKQDIVEGMEAGADDYLTKPFDPDELRVRLRAGRRILDLLEHLLSTREAMRFPNTHDPLTGVWNRESILGMLRHKLGRDTSGSPVGVILITIDHLKGTNDAYGPQAGDAVLREAAHRMRSAARVYDWIGRYTGADFLVVVPGCNTSEAAGHAETLRSAIARQPFDILSGALQVTASIGAASTADINSRDAAALIEAASRAARLAASKGCNRVETATALHGAAALADLAAETSGRPNGL